MLSRCEELGDRIKNVSGSTNSWEGLSTSVTCHRNILTYLVATSGVTVSMSAFLACHQCYCAGSSLAWGLNLRAVVCGIF